MGRGRKRKHNPTIPTHIDQAKIPAGLYWDGRGKGRWYVFETGANGRPKPKTVATAAARLSDLHTIAEQQAGADRSSLLWLCEQFELSDRFKRLKPGTRASYTKSRKVLCSQPTRIGGTFGELQARRLTRPLLQRLVDKIAAGTRRDDDGNLIPTPTKAVHVLRYLGVMLGWAANRGHVEDNIAAGIEAPIERKQHSMPSQPAFEAVIAFARDNAHSGRGGVRGRPGTCPGYLWAAAEIAYLCRLRGIEVTTLTDANVLDDGLLSNRRKGSRDNITGWSPRLRSAVDALVAHRKAIWTARSFPTPLAAKDRHLIVTVTGDPITKTGFDSAWQRMMANAIERGAITPGERFSLHGLKHRGVTDTIGTPAEKQEASGHRSARMADRYNHDVPTVLAAGETLHKKPPAA